MSSARCSVIQIEVHAVTDVRNCWVMCVVCQWNILGRWSCLVLSKTVSTMIW